MKKKPTRRRTRAPKAAPKASRPAPKRTPAVIWRLRLYVAGQTNKSLTAFANLQRLCEASLPGRYRLEVIDLVKEPHRAQQDQIIALPTLVRKLPAPIKRVIGDLADAKRVMIGIELHPDDTKK